MTTNRNPCYNRLINPAYNHMINPAYNHMINPVYNHMINPVYNHMINPVYNHMINPVYNHMINPAYNHMINPVYNRLINPLYNTQINPRVQMDIPGLYLFGWNGAHVGFTVRATEGFCLVYDLNHVLCSFFVETKSNVSLQFDQTMQWIGTWVANGNGGYNIYDSNLTLTGYTT